MMTDLFDNEVQRGDEVVFAHNNRLIFGEVQDLRRDSDGVLIAVIYSETGVVERYVFDLINTEFVV